MHCMSLARIEGASIHQPFPPKVHSQDESRCVLLAYREYNRAVEKKPLLPEKDSPPGFPEANLTHPCSVEKARPLPIRRYGTHNEVPYCVGQGRLGGGQAGIAGLEHHSPQARSRDMPMAERPIPASDASPLPAETLRPAVANRECHQSGQATHGLCPARRGVDQPEARSLSPHLGSQPDDPLVPTQEQTSQQSRDESVLAQAFRPFSRSLGSRSR